MTDTIYTQGVAVVLGGTDGPSYLDTVEAFLEEDEEWGGREEVLAGDKYNMAAVTLEYSAVCGRRGGK